MTNVAQAGSSASFPTDLVAKHTPAPRDKDELQSVDFLQALPAESSALAGAMNTLVEITDRKRAEKALRESKKRLSAELAAAQQLQRISVELVHEQDLQSLYTKLVDAAAVIMHSDCASMQMLRPEHGDKGELRLLAARGFRPQATKFWERVRADSGCTCGMALRTRERAIATDVETCDFMAGTQDRAAYLQAGIHAVQSTPLLSRSGRLLGMLSTHWREPHEPSETDLQRFDVLARQAADLVERAQAETALRASEARLRESEAQFRTLADNISQFAWMADEKGWIFWYNQRWYDYTGTTFEQMQGWGWKQVHHPDHVDRVVQRIQHSWDTGEIWEDTFPLRGKDGCYRWFLSRAQPIRDADGSIVRWFGTNTDITEKRAAEEALRESEERLRVIVNQTRAGIAQTDLTGRFELVNERYCEITGYSRDELLGMRMQEITHPEDLPHNVELFRRVTAEGVPFVIEKRYLRKDGSAIWVNNTVSLTRDNSDRPQHVVAISLDISERKQAQEQQRLLLREMNHRIKNLFALAGGVVTLSARSAETPNDLAEAVRERLAALARAHELTLPGTTGEKADRPATLPILIRAIISPLLVEKERVVITGPEVPISGNAVTSLALLLQEFATNAAKYGALASETGRIEISWCEWKGEVLLVWREQGGPQIGGPPESEHEGFGSTLARLAVTGQLGGKISRDWDKEGLTIKLSVPLDRLAIS
jgi:PAS domain S-box-containing protein